MQQTHPVPKCARRYNCNEFILDNNHACIIPCIGASDTLGEESCSDNEADDDLISGKYL